MYTAVKKGGGGPLVSDGPPQRGEKTIVVGALARSRSRQALAPAAGREQGDRADAEHTE